MITHHAQTRMQSRSIPIEAVDALLAFGETRRHRGADVYYLDRRARSRMQRSLERNTFKRLEKCLDAYVVVGDGGDIITAAHRQQRLSLSYSRRRAFRRPCAFGLPLRLSG